MNTVNNAIVNPVPIGLSPVIAYIDELCEQAEIFRRCGLSPDHLFIDLPAGEGQSTLSQYVSRELSRREVGSFRAPDLFVEHRFDGSLAQLRHVFQEIREAAVYTNDFEGIVALDAAAIASHINESQSAVFIKELTELGRSATIILFLPSFTARGCAALAEKAAEALGNVRLLHVEPYTEAERGEILRAMIEEAGVEVEDYCGGALRKLVSAGASGSSLRPLKPLVTRLVKAADFAGFTPVLTYDGILRAFPELRIELK